MHRRLWEGVVLGPDAAEHNWGSSCLGDLGAGSTDMDVPPLSQLYKEKSFSTFARWGEAEAEVGSPCPLLLFPRLDLTASLGPVTWYLWVHGAANVLGTKLPITQDL